jgi:hypothetical protein
MTDVFVPGHVTVYRTARFATCRVTEDVPGGGNHTAKHLLEHAIMLVALLPPTERSTLLAGFCPVCLAWGAPHDKCQARARKREEADGGPVGRKTG